MNAYLKVKIKSLADEARIIKKEEYRHSSKRAKNMHLDRVLADLDKRGITDKDEVAKTLRLARKSWANRQRTAQHEKNRDIFWGLRAHRLTVVRPEARAAHIAYAFLRGTPFDSVETLHDNWDDPSWFRVRDIVLKFGKETQGSNQTLQEQLYTWLSESNQLPERYMPWVQRIIMGDVNKAK